MNEVKFSNELMDLSNFMETKREETPSGELVPDDEMTPTDDAVLVLTECSVSVLANSNDVDAIARSELDQGRVVVQVPGKFGELEKIKNDILRSCLCANGQIVPLFPLDYRCGQYTLIGTVNIGVNVRYNPDNPACVGYYLSGNK